MVIDNADESRWLNKITSLIDSKIDELHDSLKEKKEDIISSKRFLWDNRAEMDSAEVAGNKQDISFNVQTYEDQVKFLARLERQRKSPYFGRIDFAETGHTQSNNLYIGIFTLTALNSVDILVYDWRAPVSSMYYDYEKGPACYVSPSGIIEGEITFKRQYRINSGTLQYMFDTDLTIDDEVLQEVLGSHTGQHMKNIVQTIQKEQNRAIRNEQSKVLIVDGVAGSGKTSVALHRAAYLLYKYRETIRPDNILILSPNNIFSEYVSNVLPELGEDNILQTTFGNFAENTLGRRFQSRGHYFEDIFSRHNLPQIRGISIQLKTSSAFLNILKQYAQQVGEQIFSARDLVIGEKIIMSKNRIKSIYSDYRDILPLSKRIELLKERIVFKTGVSSRSTKGMIIRKIDDMFKNLDARTWYARLFENSEFLSKLSQAGGYDATVVADISLFTSRTLAKRKILHEDLAPILYLKSLLEGLPNSESIKHLIVDEVQDYSPIHLEIFKQIFVNANMTLLGDGNQLLNPYSEDSLLDQADNIFQDKTYQVIKLTKSYRSTYEITRFANSIIGLENEANTIGRHGEPPLLVKTNPDNRKQDIFRIIDDLKTKGYKSSTAILCKTLSEVDELLHLLGDEEDVSVLRDDTSEYKSGLIISPIYLAKGLEFDAVILFNASHENYNENNEKSLLYVACTRALHELVIVYENKPSPLLMLDRERYGT